MLTRNVVGRWGWVAWGLTAGCLTATACGGKDEGAPPGTGVGNTANTGNQAGRGGSAGKGGGGGTGATGDGGMSGDMGTAATGDTGTGGTGATGEPDAAAPVVKVISPKAETDPNGDDVLVDSEIDVICRVTQSPEDGSREVVESTIVMQMLDADGNVVPSADEGTVPGALTSKPDEYSAHFILTEVPKNGKVSFRCSASDASDPPLTGSHTLTTLLDHGPTITRSEPGADSPHPLDGALHVEFSVDAAPVAKGDKGAKVASVELLISGVPIDVDENDGVYTADVALNDSSLFATPPSGDTPITIRATNSRTPEAVTAVDSYRFIVDSDGPEITVTLPEHNGSIVGGFVTLGFDAVDEGSGVDPETITVTILGKAHPFGKDGTWTADGDHYTYQFDSSRLIEDTEYQTTLIIRADDRAGNSSDGESWLIYLDNVPPIVDLNPANVRQWRKTGSAYECSASFDPLGVAIGDDLDNVANLARLTDNSVLVRALVWDRTNTGIGAKYSGNREDDVRIYVQPKTDEPLLRDLSGGPECDDIDEEAQQNLEFIRVIPVPSDGAAYFHDDGADTAPPISSFGPGCTFGAETSPPARLCTDEASDLSAVIKHSDEGHPPVVFALDPHEGLYCNGAYYELSGHAEEGWVCLVGRAKDNIGNVGISRPLRVCFDDFRTDTHPACLDGLNPPSCTDGCELPPAFPTEPEDYFVFPP